MKQIRETRTVFYGSSLNPMSLSCGLITVEATPGKEPKGIANNCCTRNWSGSRLWSEQKLRNEIRTEAMSMTNECRNSVLIFMLSLASTSRRHPLCAYNMTSATFGAVKHTPTKRFTFSCFTDDICIAKHTHTHVRCSKHQRLGLKPLFGLVCPHIKSPEQINEQILCWTLLTAKLFKVPLKHL